MTKLPTPPYRQTSPRRIAQAVRSALRFRCTLVALLAIWALPSSVFAICGLNIDGAAVHWRDTGDRYDPFASRALSGDLNVRVRRVATGPADASAELPESGEASAPATADVATDDEVDVGLAVDSRCLATVEVMTGAGELRSSTEVLLYQVGAVADQAASDVIERLGVGEQANLRYPVTLAPNQGVAAGDYRGELSVRLSSGTEQMMIDAGEEAFDSTQRVPFGVRVESAALLGLAGTLTRAAYVDLGKLRTGATTRLPVSLSLRTTSAYSLRFESENAGALSQERSGRKWLIPYSLFVDGQRIALGTTDSSTYTGNATGASEVRLPIDIVLGNVEQSAAGEYRDRLRVEILPVGL